MIGFVSIPSQGIGRGVLGGVSCDDVGTIRNLLRMNGRAIYGRICCYHRGDCFDASASGFDHGLLSALHGRHACVEYAPPVAAEAPDQAIQVFDRVKSALARKTKAWCSVQPRKWASVRPRHAIKAHLTARFQFSVQSLLIIGHAENEKSVDPGKVTRDSLGRY